MFGFVEHHPVTATGLAVAGSVASFVAEATLVLQFVTALAATVVAVVAAYSQIRKLLDGRDKE